MKQFFSRIWNWWKTRSLGHRVILIFLVLLVVVFANYLDEGSKPWGRDGLAYRLDSGKKPKAEHFAVDGIYKGVTYSLVLAVLLVPFAGFFGRKLSKDFKPEERRKPGRGEALLLFFVVLGSATVTCAYALPRFKHSMWHDEELSMRRCIVHDHLRVGEDGRSDRFGVMAERPVPWAETLWFYESPNNHMFFSVCARLIHTMWPGEQAPDKPFFNASAIRLAALIPAVLTLAVLAVFLSVIGFRIAAFALPPLLAMHPWFIRYASEGRGYALAMLLLSLCLLFFWKAVATGKWRWFGVFGLVQFLLLFTNPSSVWFLVALNCAGFFVFLIRKGSKEDRWTLIGRWTFTNLIAGMVTFTMMMPLQLQVKFGHMEIAYGVELFKNMGGSFLTGMRWLNWNANLEFLVSGEQMLKDDPVLVGTILIVIVALALLGLFALARKGGRYALLIPVIVLPVPLFLAFTYWKNVILHHWYTVNLLPLLWIAVAIGIGYLAGLFGGRKEKGTMVAGAVLIVVFGAAFWWVGEGQRQMQIEVPLEKPLESVLATRDVLDPFDPRHDEVLTVGFHKYTRAYDPGHYRVRTADEMRMMMEKADAEGKPLFVNFAQPDFARAHMPELLAVLDDPELFEVVDIFYAMEDTATRWVIKYKPGSWKKDAST